MTVYEIPLTPEPQTFSISLAGSLYVLTLKWNNFAGYWVLDIANPQSAPILCGLPLLPSIDILAPYSYLNFGFQLFCATDDDPTAVPTFANLGVTSHLYIGVDS